MRTSDMSTRGESLVEAGSALGRGVKAEQIIVGGYSMGGFIATRAALTFPEPLGGLLGVSWAQNKG